MSADINVPNLSTDGAQLPVQLLGQSDAGSCCGGACCS
jgi:hypothetical protein